jgi:hypothetical protein
MMNVKVLFLVVVALNRVSPKKNSFAFWRPRGFTARDRLNSNPYQQKKIFFFFGKKEFERG